MRILALNPPFLPRFSRESRGPAVAKSGTLYYPMWLAHGVGGLEQAGHEVLFLDAPAAGLSPDGILERTRRFAPSLAVVDTSTPSISSDVEVTTRLKAAFPDLFAVLVGPHVSALPRETLEQNYSVDAVAFREYDATLVELAAQWTTSCPNRKLRSVAGLAFRDRRGRVVVNSPRPFIEDLDRLPMVSAVYKRHLDITPYFYAHSRHPLVVITTGRGCPYACTFCVLPQVFHGHRYRRRSIPSVVGEFKYIAHNFPNVKEIMIEDDTLTADPGRCRELARALVAVGATSIPWSANARADVDVETMRLMRRAGCRLFCVGFESGDQTILDNINKHLPLERARTFVRDARHAGIMVHGCFMFGNRGETSATCERTLHFARELNPDTAQFYPIMAYPGTADFEYFRRKGWISTTDFWRWLTEDGQHATVVDAPGLGPDSLRALCARARREFYLRPRYVLAKLLEVARRPSEAERIVRAFRTIRVHLLPSRTQNCPVSS